MGRDSINTIWLQVKANGKRLRECVGPHQFVAMKPGPRRTIPEFYECTRCLGQVDSRHRTWYEEGLRHGLEHAGQPAAGEGDST